MIERELLVLAASSDFGRALIRKVHKNYNKIYAHYRNETDEMKSLVDEVGANKLKWYRADLESEEQIEKMLQEIDADGGHPAHIVHFPSMPVEYGHFHKTDWKQYERRFNIALRSLVLVLKKYLPQMRKQKAGKIIVMASSCTVGTPPKQIASYVAEKYALVGMVKALAAEYAHKSIQINAVSPEMTDTKFLDALPELIVSHNALNNPLKRNISISEVIPTMEFLLSDGADRITGQNIVITGGMEM